MLFVGMRQKESSLCILETEARKRQLLKCCKNMPVKRKGVSDRANQAVFEASKVIHVRKLYDLVQATGEME